MVFDKNLLHLIFYSMTSEKIFSEHASKNMINKSQDKILYIIYYIENFL